MIRSYRQASRMALLPAVLFTLAACDDDPARPGVDAPNREYGVVLNSVSASLTVFPLAAPDSTRAIALDPSSTATSVAVRGDIALVPLGLVSAVAVVDLRDGVVERTIPLPSGSGATGVAIVSDSLALVANPGLNLVTPVRYRAGTTAGAIPVGPYPTALLAAGGEVFVVEANLEGFVPAGPSSISVIDVSSLAVTRTFQLSGENAADAAHNGSTLFVLNAGVFDSASATLSEAATPLAAQTAHHTGFGLFANEIEVLANGQLAIASPVYGIAVFDAGSASFVATPDAALLPGGASNVLGIGTDLSDRLWLVDAGDCASPGTAMLLTSAFAVAQEVEVGVCPDAIVFTEF